jgi:hypothetical protein
LPSVRLLTAGEQINEDDDTTNTEAGLVNGRAIPLRKVLFSAMLTQNPQKFARLGLVNPKHYDASFLKRSAQEMENVVDDDDARAGRYSSLRSCQDRLSELKVSAY